MVSAVPNTSATVPGEVVVAGRRQDRCAEGLDQRPQPAAALGRTVVGEIAGQQHQIGLAIAERSDRAAHAFVSVRRIAGVRLVADEMRVGQLQRP